MIFAVSILTLIILMSALDDKIIQEYSPFFSFCRELNEKMAHYPNKGVTWLKVYMNLVLPCFAYLGISGAWNIYQTYPVKSVEFIVSAVFAIIMFTNLFLFREIDRLAYYFNIVASLSVLARLVIAYWDVLAGELFTIIFWGICIAISLSYFYEKRELFFLTKRELALKYTLL